MVAVALDILTVAAGVSREVKGAAWTRQKKSSTSKMDPLVKFCAVGPWRTRAMFGGAGNGF
jgi:hypothetical protein